MDEEILETAKSICACGAEDEALLKRLCAASAQALERELREGVAPEDCEGAFICASAWLAAAALRRSARQLMAPYTEGGGFFFCAVKG